MSMSPERTASVERLLKAHPSSVLAKEWERYRSDKAAGIVRCGDCGTSGIRGRHLTEINAEGHHNRPQFLVCDDCMCSGRWDDWKTEYWPTWPEKS